MGPDQWPRSKKLENSPYLKVRNDYSQGHNQELPKGLLQKT